MRHRYGHDTDAQVEVTGGGRGGIETQGRCVQKGDKGKSPYG